ncbi:MAG TPA: YtxH domain-containing protein [Candidatus Limnocylindria bacterium]
MADEVATTVRSIVDKVLEADVPDQIARRGRDFASAVTEATDAVSIRAAEAWRDSAPTRRDAEKTMRKASREAASWSRRTWKKEVRPALRDLWKRRSLALGAAGAAIPAGREVVDDAAVRLGIKRREERHWMAFFVGLLVGAAAGAIIALLTAPKAGRQMRDELGVKARDAAEKAREAAGNAEWVPLFQRAEPQPEDAISSEAGNGAVAEPETPAAESIPVSEPEIAMENVSETAEGEELH